MERLHSTRPGDVTLLLRRFGGGDPVATSRLMEFIYPELRRIAQVQFRREREGHDLEPTALVHEAFLRLVAHEHHTWENRGRFFAAAANVMRRILIEHARARDAQKRDQTNARMTFDDELSLTRAQSADLLDLDQALTELEQLSPRQARVIEMRYFSGLSVPEIAKALGLNPRSVDRDWATARAWLRNRLHA